MSTHLVGKPVSACKDVMVSWLNQRRQTDGDVH